MKPLQLSFEHPVKGHAFLLQLFSQKPDKLSFEVDSKNSNLLEIPVNQCKEGKWKLTLDWEYNEQTFSHQEVFEIKEE